MKKVKRIPEVGFQILSRPEGSGVILEILDECEVAFMEVGIDLAGTRCFTVYETPEFISIPFSELQRIVEIAEREVQEMDPEGLFEQ